MKAVFLDRQTFTDNIDLTAIQAQVEELICYNTTNNQEVLERAANADIIITNKVILNQTLLSQLPNLKLICITATGVNNVDLKAAAELNINVLNVSGYSTNSVAQYVFAQLLQYFSQIAEKNQQVKNGLWPKSATFCMHHQPFVELAGKTLGILGYGNLGQKVADIARAFDMQVLVAERPNTTTIRADRVSFQEMLSKADVVSAHCPLTPETEKLFSANVFNAMQKHAVFINTARGGIVDNQALKQALLNGDIAAAILDVLDQEPPAQEHILLTPQPDNLFITAHIAWASQESQQRLIELVAKNIMLFKAS